MEWSDIRVFLQVVRDGTMTEATHSLNLDHSTISRRIARLEKKAGVPLFERAGRRLSITAEGSRLAEAAEKLESIILREIMSLSEVRSRIAGKVRIATTEDFGAHYLAPRIPEITEVHEELEVELVSLPRGFSLATREADLVITMDRPTTGDVRCRKLTSFTFGIYAGVGYFEDGTRPSRLAELTPETWCGYVRELLHTPELDALVPELAGIRPRLRTTSVTAQLGTVLAGSAIALLPCFLSSTYGRLERLLPEVAPTREYWLAVHEDLATSPRVRTVMDAVGAMVVRDRHLFIDVSLQGHASDWPGLLVTASDPQPAGRRSLPLPLGPTSTVAGA